MKHRQCLLYQHFNFCSVSGLLVAVLGSSLQKQIPWRCIGLNNGNILIPGFETRRSPHQNVIKVMPSWCSGAGCSPSLALNFSVTCQCTWWLLLVSCFSSRFCCLSTSFCILCGIHSVSNRLQKSRLKANLIRLGHIITEVTT